MWCDSEVYARAYRRATRLTQRCRRWPKFAVVERDVVNILQADRGERFEGDDLHAVLPIWKAYRIALKRAKFSGGAATQTAPE